MKAIKDSFPPVIITGGTQIEEDIFYLPFLQKSSYRIAADAGLRVCYRLQIPPDLFIGDGDSVKEAEWKWLQLQNIPIQKFPSEKDSTDTQLALEVMIQRGEKEIYILGGIGSRLDHTLGNLYLLVYAYRKGIKAWLINPYHEIQLLTPEYPVQVKGKIKELVSIIPISKKLEEVTLKGFRWELTNETIVQGNSVGISNYLIQSQGYLWIKKGLAWVMKVKE